MGWMVCGILGSDLSMILHGAAWICFANIGGHQKLKVKSFLSIPEQDGPFVQSKSEQKQH